MRARTPDGTKLRVHRRLLPWRRKVRDVDTFDGLDTLADLGSGIDDIFGGIVGAILLVLALILAIPIIVMSLVVVGELLLLLLLLPVFLLARIAFKQPWIVEVTVHRKVVHAEAVVGWKAAGVRERHIAKLISVGAPLADPSAPVARLGGVRVPPMRPLR